MPEQKRTYQYIGLKTVHPYKYKPTQRNDGNDDDNQDIFSFWPMILYIIFGMYLAALMYAAWTSRCENLKYHRNIHH